MFLGCVVVEKCTEVTQFPPHCITTMRGMNATYIQFNRFISTNWTTWRIFIFICYKYYKVISFLLLFVVCFSLLMRAVNPVLYQKCSQNNIYISHCTILFVCYSNFTACWWTIICCCCCCCFYWWQIYHTHSSTHSLSIFLSVHNPI